ncbi:helix-turn-helix transcriptional regulator [Pelagibius litoralis]|uniref:Helix-turn-helix transcriptional regulator n=1 Tax=Pelagibius litoralis TaxID=374515 RepID=A0A967F1V0_9PROT|nr:helix-turn-helix transcriptional regulator [Pelagibius litoralis]NIA71628.1 helix-turn-helix transcriptional regulator [Pelagibius litoralis]
MAKASLITDSSSPGNGAGAVPVLPEPFQIAGKPIITGPQCRAARAMLRWSREDLGERASIHYITLCNFELGHNALKPGTAQLLRLTFEAAGVLLIDDDGSGGPGVCLAKPVT